MKTITPDTTTTTSSQHQQLLIPQADQHHQPMLQQQSLLAAPPPTMIMEHVNLVDDDEKDPLALEQLEVSPSTKHTQSQVSSKTIYPSATRISKFLY